MVNIRLREDKTSLIGYTVMFEGMPHVRRLDGEAERSDKRELTDEEKRTQQYDREAFRIVSYFAFPILFGYGIYSLLYQ